jgi:membrane associated rhomboid family serine protease
MFNLTPTVRNLLLANIAFYLLQVNLRLSPSITQLGSLYPLGSPFFHFWQFFTYMFLHDPSGWGHILANMFGLISFGPLLEQRWGGQRFLAFWLMCGVGAGLIYEGVRVYEQHKLEAVYADVVRSPNAYDYDQYMQQSGLKNVGGDDAAAASALARNPNDQNLQQAVIERVKEVNTALQTLPIGGMLGASGALFGLLFAFGYLFPNTELFLLFIPFPIKAKYFVFFYGLYELYAGIHRTPGDSRSFCPHRRLADWIYYSQILGKRPGSLLLKFSFNL